MKGAIQFLNGQYVKNYRRKIASVSSRLNFNAQKKVFKHESYLTDRLQTLKGPYYPYINLNDRLI